MARDGFLGRALTRAVVFALSSAVCACTTDAAPKRQAEVEAARAALTTSTTLMLTGDTYLRSGSPNLNLGSEPIIRLQSSGQNRGLLFFDPAAIQAAVGTDVLTSAALELPIDNAGTNWSAAGRPIALHRLKQASASSLPHGTARSTQRPRTRALTVQARRRGT